MNSTQVNPFLSIVFSLVIFILALVGIGGVEFGPFSQELLWPFD